MDAIPRQSAPLLPYDSIVRQGDSFRASFAAGLCSLSSATITSAVLSIPFVIKILGVVPGVISILVFRIIVEQSIQLLIRFSDDGRAFTYANLMEDSFGRNGKILWEICIIISRIGICIICLIIVADVISGSESSGIHHSGILEEWFGEHWWTGRAFVLIVLNTFVMIPEAWFHMDHSMSSSFVATTGGLAMFLVISLIGITVYELAMGTIEKPALFPRIINLASFWNLFTAVPVLVCAYLSHFNVHKVQHELGDSFQMQSVLKSSLSLCGLAYIFTGLFGFLLFGNSTTYDLLSNFSSDTEVPFRWILYSTVRLGYAFLIVLVFPTVFCALRFDVDQFELTPDVPMSSHYTRYALITYGLLLVILLGAMCVPSIWAVLQFIGMTTGALIFFIFPACIALRDHPGIATKKHKIVSWSSIILGVLFVLPAIYSNMFFLF